MRYLVLLSTKAVCKYCNNEGWTLSGQEFKCRQCKLHLSIRAHTSDHQDVVDSEEYSTPVPLDDMNRPSDDFKSASRRQYILNDFELGRVIGQGSYGKVFAVVLKDSKQIYAMKVIEKSPTVNNINRLQTEKRILEIACNHPFLVGLHCCFQTLSRLCFVVEFARGGDLLFHMQRHRKLLEKQAGFYAAEISLALHFLHRNGIIYRDLKLDNVLLDHEGHIKLTDYGLSKDGIRAGQTTSSFCGTPNYMAPEMLQGRGYGFSIDWWALGVLLYEMLVGKSPFNPSNEPTDPGRDETMYVFRAILEEPVCFPNLLSVNAVNVLNSFLNKNPTERLGCHGSDSFSEITYHPFFKNIDWDKLEQKQVPPPYKPQLHSDQDLTHFPSEFTKKPVYFDPDDQSVIDEIDQSDFQGFEFVNTSLLLIEDCV